MAAIDVRSCLALASFVIFFQPALAGLSTRDIAARDPLPGLWRYEGCHVDVDRSLYHATHADTVGMTGINCISYCQSRGYSYAGTEWYHECYCGSVLAPGAVAAPEGDCNTPCVGNSTEFCGGPLKLSLYHNPAAVGPRPNTAIPKWQHIGCYAEGTTGRALTYAVTTIPTGQNTGANCAAACEAQGFTLAGTEYSGECFCGNNFSNGGGPAPDGEALCNMVCSGSSSEICGGPNRLSVYSLSVTCPASNGATYTTNGKTFLVECYVDHLANDLIMAYTTSYAACFDACSSASGCVAFAWVPGNPGPCYMKSAVGAPISNTGVWGAQMAALSSSSSTSTSLSTSSATTPSTTTSSAAPTAPITCPGSDGATYVTLNNKSFLVECYIDHLAGDMNMAYAASYVTCLETCSSTSGCVAFAWIPGAPGPCYMKSSVGSPISNMGVWGAQIVTAPLSSLSGSTSLSSTSLSTSATSTTASSTSTSATPSSTGLPTGWSYQGCWHDNVNGARILAHAAPVSPTMTQESCAQTCFSLGYNVSGTEYAQECFCGNAIIYGGVQVPDSQCNMPCAGDGTQMCGAGNRLSVCANGPPIVYPVPQVQTSGLEGSWAYQGCLVDTPGGERVFPWQLMLTDNNSANECLRRCAKFGYMAGGLQYHNECYCGDPKDVTGSGNAWVPESECNTACTGNATALCGGQNRLSVYYWTGSPLYTWEYPIGVDAGAYVFLIGGVCIPLMTQEAITGKVVFVEKLGTGPGNSTGSYELDLTKIDNFSEAWRPLHVKTDVFCAAGLTLPDKGARHLNIGGWSGESTYGLRLYWPDGSDGVPGTRDWEENVNLLSLQDGRWYPTGIVLANGSVLVVGGQVGANGAAVPTLEILPPTGTPPMYLDFLERTDPNNLYPFMAVLPQGGVFIAYWNEARILDETTFETITVLPDIPGSVVDPMAGRTYPLEGTGVLLPQVYPFTSPLGLLICGGSTMFSGAALDNCVSIYPQAPNPTWTIERMPSRRVISCMAPLPDGTYLILNGAQQGVAGFGLAGQPNLNAVLYDPSKPEGARMSVMANTTIARMYHSEAITLLDGRVLVSGSDAQDNIHPQEYRVETFDPPYLTKGLPRPSFDISEKDWAYGQTNIPFTLGQAAQNGDIKVTLLGSVSSTHGNSMGTRTLFPKVACSGSSCTVEAPPNALVCPPGWYQMFVLDGGVPAHGVYVRIGGDPAGFGNWPPYPEFSKPGM